MRIDFNISQQEKGNFLNACEAVIRNVGTGTRAATLDAASSIMSESLEQVPVDTGALISSAFAGVSRREDLSKNSYRYGAILGYGDIRALTQHMELGPVEWYMKPTNPINRKSGLPASVYASRVHEDLDMPHPNGGKAKFLEDPVRNWASGKFARTAMTYWARAISYKGPAPGRYATALKLWNRRERIFEIKFVKMFRFPTRYLTFTQKGTGIQRGGKTVHKGSEL